MLEPISLRYCNALFLPRSGRQSIHSTTHGWSGVTPKQRQDDKLPDDGRQHQHSRLCRATPPLLLGGCDAPRVKLNVKKYMQQTWTTWLINATIRTTNEKLKMKHHRQTDETRDFFLGIFRWDDVNLINNGARLARMLICFTYLSLVADVCMYVCRNEEV